MVSAPDFKHKSAAFLQHTPSQHLAVLEQNYQSEDAIKLLAHGLPERESVWYACQSSQRVAGKLAPADKEALAAAERWVKNPTPETQAAAAAAAAKTDFQGPGAWAAQGAAWSQPAASGASPAGAVTTPRLTPQAVARSVLLSAAIAANPKLAAPKLQPAVPALNIPEMPQLPQYPQIPKVAAPTAPAPAVMGEMQANSFRAQHPFIAAGIDIASGKARSSLAVTGAKIIPSSNIF
jgi:hypothetical protein